jgi:aryl-alcohol dehydrogenase-like predicted oxidoreductase
MGTMQYGSGQEWMIPDHDEGVKQLKYAYDKGINVSLRLHFASVPVVCIEN